MLQLRSTARSDVGLVRAGNEDSGYAGSELLIVADGMGGHAAGELASAAAIATMAAIEPAGLDDAEAIARLSDAVSVASERIADVVAANPEFAGMGTTLTALAWLGTEPPRVAVIHVGDSRAYLLRDQVLTQLTRDHTYVQSLIDAGELTPEEAAKHPRRNLLMRAIDGIHQAEPDVSVREARVGDRYLVCSDGLCGYVADVDIQRLLALPDATAAVTALVDSALEVGAPDNVTCVVADVVEADSFPAEAARPVVVGAAGESRNRERLPGFVFPIDQQRDSGAQILRVSSRAESSPAEASGLAVAYREGRRRGRSRWKWAVSLALLALIAGGVSAFIYSWAHEQFYVGTNSGNLTIFRGVPGTLGPIHLQVVEHQTDLTVDALPDFEAMQVEATISTETLESASQIVQRLTERAAQCGSAPTTPGCPTAGSSAPTPPAATPTAT